ncbi:hypothetical protein [Christiangramia crocea]|uniref:Uncharacterized protein n=1 Tax=Christiangramia crocea TaxID=2904124 RepID=A0A9X2A6G5_9FLAO|nr:hypothetical protein [Gramella crocea]MCG9970981.1 hypothetical protein [Gramella crocea]
MQINFNYINVPKEEIKKLEKSRKFLCDSIGSRDYYKVFEGFEHHKEFVNLINGITVNIVIDDAIRELPAKYTKATKTVTITAWALERYSIEKLAGYIAHEITHEWWSHGSGAFGSFVMRLIDLLPTVDVKPSLFKRIWNWIKNLFT